MNDLREYAEAHGQRLGQIQGETAEQFEKRVLALKKKQDKRPLPWRRSQAE